MYQLRSEIYLADELVGRFSLTKQMAPWPLLFREAPCPGDLVLALSARPLIFGNHIAYFWGYLDPTGRRGVPRCTECKVLNYFSVMLGAVVSIVLRSSLIIVCLLVLTRE